MKYSAAIPIMGSPQLPGNCSDSKYNFRRLHRKRIQRRIPAAISKCTEIILSELYTSKLGENKYISQVITAIPRVKSSFYILMLPKFFRNIFMAITSTD